MLDLKCWGCGRAGRVRARYAGLRVTCKLCGTVNAVADPDAEEIHAAFWQAEAGAAVETIDVEVEPPTRSRSSPWRPDGVPRP
jgi:hypothetical protein